ncbi:penicillin-binding protein 1A [Aetokthonos hydrillicola Thurmond2011]|uniref:Penicillin-binding protein 1A n=1 Tax=Aetokthonos hydrillicola Thurmond2011 TaxID=2712845 RepID=A0AAP5IGN1_9CYAN|nr:penicillin-binding protein 1A [Aetokthonos hydrillicola]MBO3459747.1 penicillin-binding protein 1A [Aetokthonos hydrillicola CCALA 1050]MBW4585179.1 penicillin-binding protein 1A [Aetokthonos hydrillicola CCALA 1050]MDR9899518.1 penicillin-binding protein 1A [Aetokthonos hydrillicola Thurmond2011]
MLNFTSWFKERSTKLRNSAQENQALLPEDREENEESTDESLPPTKQVKQKRKPRENGSKPSGRLTKLILFSLALTAGGGIVGANYFIGSIDRSLPDKAELNAVTREQTLTIKAADGTILQQQGDATREQLKLEQIPDKLKKAFVASEDRRYYQHKGVDYQGIVRAVFNNLRSQNVVEGGSTITQQLARILFLKQERTIWRKVKEARLAEKIEHELTKEDILERYLNLVYLGSGAYGVADAAWVYFSKPVNKLSLGEMATIAGLPPAPNRFSPQVNIKAATQRRDIVLQRMLEDNYITASEKAAAQAEQLTIHANPPKRWQVESPYFISYIQKELPKYVSAKVLQAGGLTVETSLNRTWEKTAEEAIAKTLRNQGRWENFKQAAIVAIDPRTGEIQAMVGGKDFGKNQFNRVTQAQRQPGSTFKGFVYAAAIASGKNPYDTYLDQPFKVDGYEPKNFTKDSFHGQIDMVNALTKSINIVAVKVLIDVGFKPTIKLAHDMGIKSNLNPNYSLALGSNEVNLLELTSAYGSFATNGLHAEPHGIRRILDRRGKVIWSANFKPKRAIDADSAAIMTWMLRNVVTDGTGRPAQLDRPVAGKTGTTDDARDLWFIGYIPQLVTGVWLGNDNNNPTDGSSGSAAETWHEFMNKAVKGMPVEKFPARPKLEGRKGTLKREPVKPKSVVYGSSGSDEQNKDDDNGDSEALRPRGERSNQRRRSRRYSQEYQEQQPQQEVTPRRRRRRYEEQQTDNSTQRRSYSRRSRSEQTNSGESYSGNSRQATQTNSSPPRSNSSTPSSSSSSEHLSWRDRLRPTSP